VIEFLTERQIPFVVRDVQKEIASRMQLLSRGCHRTPVTIIGSTVLHGFDRHAFEEAFKARTSSLAETSEPATDEASSGDVR
jgi:hypothetical protein